MDRNRLICASRPIESGRPLSRHADDRWTIGTYELVPTFRFPILQERFSRHDAHKPRRIRYFLPAFEAADVIESASIAMRPRGARVQATKYVRDNPLDPRHFQIFVRLRVAGAPVCFRLRGLTALRIKSEICLRARAVRAFTVPWGTPRICAVSRIDKPSMCRSW